MEKIQYKNPIAIVYHAGCLDGVAAATAVMDDIINDPSLTYDVETYPVTYKCPVPDLSGKDVYIVDFSWPPEVLLPAITKAKHVTIIDHHQSAMDKWDGVELPVNLTLVFDNSMSGALLTWKTMEGAGRNDNPPKLLKHISDRDLWKFEYRDTKYICEYVMSRMSDLSNIGEFHRMYTDSILNEASFFQNAIQMGQVMIHCRETLMHKSLKRNLNHYTVFGHENIPVANIAYEFASDAGDFLAMSAPFSVTYEDNLSTGLRRFSLRSNKETGIPVREFAERMGGGGHDYAAGFYIPLKDIKDNEFKFFA